MTAKPTLPANASAHRILRRANYLMSTGMQYPRAAIKAAAWANLTHGNGSKARAALELFETTKRQSPSPKAALGRAMVRTSRNVYS